jgi:hypothetical protein
MFTFGRVEATESTPVTKGLPIVQRSGTFMCGAPR